MKLATGLATLALCVGPLLVAALSDKEKTALATFNVRYHPKDHTTDMLVTELSEYSANAGLAATKTMFDQKSYAQAGQSLSDHIASIRSDPLLQTGKQLAMPFAMLNDCVGELRSKFK